MRVRREEKGHQECKASHALTRSLEELWVKAKDSTKRWESRTMIPSNSKEHMTYSQHKASVSFVCGIVYFPLCFHEFICRGSEVGQVTSVSLPSFYLAGPWVFSFHTWGNRSNWGSWMLSTSLASVLEFQPLRIFDVIGHLGGQGQRLSHQAVMSNSQLKNASSSWNLNLIHHPWELLQMTWNLWDRNGCISTLGLSLKFGVRPFSVWNS